MRLLQWSLRILLAFIGGLMGLLLGSRVVLPLLLWTGLFGSPECNDTVILRVVEPRGMCAAPVSWRLIPIASALIAMVVTLVIIGWLNRKRAAE